MTENEVFEHISNLAGDYKCFDEKISHQESLMLCNLIEEIQQYRAIGTVEEITKLINFLSYDDDTSIIEDLQMLAEYHSIGTVEEFKALKEKSVAKKPLFVPTDDTCLYQEYRCPSCNEWLADKFKPYRCKCGQKLNWQ